MNKSIVLGFVVVFGASAGALGCRSDELVAPMHAPMAVSPPHDPTVTATSEPRSEGDDAEAENAGRGRSDKFLWDNGDTAATR